MLGSFEGHLAMTDDYDPMDDVRKSWSEAYRIIRERMAAGGAPWTPKPNDTTLDNPPFKPVAEE